MKELKRMIKDGELDPQIGIYRDADNGPCEICMLLGKDWEDRVVSDTVVYKCQLRYLS